MAKRRFPVRFLVLATLLVGTAFFLHARSGYERIPKSEKLAAFPKVLGAWQGRELEIPADVLQILGPGDFLSRVYQQPNGPHVDLFIAYFPSQKTGDTIHSPRNCLPAGGWSFVQSRKVQLTPAGRPAITVNRYVIAKGTDRLLVLYWYQAHGRAVPSEYSAKFYLVADAIRLNRTDGALVRVITPIEQSEAVEQAQARASGFAEQFLPVLSRYIPD